MIPSWQEISRSLLGAVLLARRDPAGMACFDLSVDGFWRSFFAMVIAAPAYAVLTADRWHAAEQLPSLGLIVFGEALGYVAGWVAFPLAAIFITRHLNLAARYVPMVIASNWSAVLQVAVFLTALVVAGTIGGPAGSFVLLMATVAVLFYQWFVIRTALESSGGIAAMLVAIDVLLSSVVSRGAELLILGA